MKKIEAIIRNIKVEDVKEALDEIGVNGLTVTDVIGAGRKKRSTVKSNVENSKKYLKPNVKIEVVVEKELVDFVIKTIVNSARTGEKGDGKIFVIPVENTIRIRSGEKGLTAV